VGVDDWAQRRGKRYGTILIDLERHRPVDLLPERSSESFRAWLQDHPEVETISRDRGDCYIKGAELGAPQAIQVADRWHLLHNLQDALVQLVDRHRKQLKTVGKSMGQSTAKTDSIDPPACPATRKTKAELAREERHQRRLERFQQLVELHAQGLGIREIARRMRMHRRTVRLWISRRALPDRAARCSRRNVDKWADYLHQRWQEGCQNASTLTAELRLMGYKGSYDMVRRCVAGWRQRCNSHDNRVRTRFARQPLHCDSPRSIAWALMKPSVAEQPDQQRLAKLFRESCPEVDRGVQLALQFRQLVSEKRAGELDIWIAQAVASDAPSEIRRFAAGLKPDLAAVKAALELCWSNGQTEWQVNRLKWIKRQMYGRANFDLLRKRVLARTG
jgi:transposase